MSPRDMLQGESEVKRYIKPNKYKLATTIFWLKIQMLFLKYIV